MKKADFTTIINVDYTEAMKTKPEQFVHRDTSKIAKALNQDENTILLFNKDSTLIIEDLGLRIDKKFDDWYYIYYKYAYFKCDQINGVVECLQSL